MSKMSLLKRVGVLVALAGTMVVAPAIAGLGSSIANASACVAAGGTQNTLGVPVQTYGTTCQAANTNGSSTVALTICTNALADANGGNPGTAVGLHSQSVLVSQNPSGLTGGSEVDAYDSNFPLDNSGANFGLGNLFLTNLLTLTNGTGPQGSATVAGVGITGDNPSDC